MNNGIEFSKGVALDVRKYTKEVDGAVYVPWASAIEIAGAASQAVVEDSFGGEGLAPELFGGGLVCVRQNGEDVFLPIMNAKSYPVAYGAITSRDIGDAISRCRARAAACINGVGLSLYSTDFGADGQAYTMALGVRPTMTRADLVRVEFLTDRKDVKDKKTKKVIRSTPYLGWHAAMAAARITDPEFRWHVESRPLIDTSTGEVRAFPAVKAPGTGWMVGVTVTWRGLTHTEWLPIMGVMPVETKYGIKPLENQPIADPSVADWHRAVMRCFAKSVAIATGYGIQAYAKDLPDDPAVSDSEDTVPPATTVGGDPGQEALITSIREHLAVLGKDEAKFTAWLQIGSVEAAPIEALKQGLSALEEMRRATDSSPADA